MITELRSKADLVHLYSFMKEVRPSIEQALMSNVPAASWEINGGVSDAIRRALFPGGKRLRPALTILGAELFGGSRLGVLEAATAVEYIHVSSLVFDDLPCMDNTSIRRGQPALHLQFNEGVAVLAAIALLNKAYSLVVKSLETKCDLAFSSLTEITKCIEAQVFGQGLDLTKNSMPRTMQEHDDIQSMRNLKASALIGLSIKLGAIFSNAPENGLATLSNFSILLGNAFQISDDIADQAEDNALHHQSRHTTMPVEYGERTARARVLELTKEAKDILIADFGSSSTVSTLCEIADYVALRCQ